MAYTKTTWKNNVTDIDENNLNKIEKGIYDNSLVIDVITKKLNPTDTETYKTAELTEGQITDVIGVNDIIIKGQTSQNGEPTPSSPVDVNVVSGSNVINIYNNQTLSKKLSLDLGSIELCKIGDYQDYFYKSGSKWYLHKEIGKVILDGSENWGSFAIQNNNLGRARLTLENVFYSETLNTVLSNKLVGSQYQQSWNLEKESVIAYSNNSIFIQLDVSTLSEFKEKLATGYKVYYVLATATNTEITDTTLISQLEAIYNAPLYEQTNITQTNNDLPMVLDITACKDNINGIKAFIRK